ncbi:MAG TPA: P-loop NTPase [Bacilli bacterium]|jgi:ATP-binding protein involved in chromosome partitioning|nr:P-loop NTPase [Bacilli bacterium]HOD60505.1 P-loop NTPase [Bacilli bacterium]HOH61735.1 P-loop NTPase [Bacilli bacterium]HPB49301.1 P-loop NTPase [Bacilli bacterium]HPM14594.1 P-loop NTPase [Bacilli bacterium]
MTTKEIRKHIEMLIDESTGQTLQETNAIKHIGIDPEKNVVVLIIAVGRTGGEQEKKLRRELARIIKINLGFAGVKLQIEEKRKIESIVNRNVKFIIISSGKGGVGKSTVAANLAYALTRLGKKVALVDADIYGSSIPKILEMQHRYPNASEDGKILPFEAYGMEIISTEFFAEIGKPIIWRGAMLNSMMNNFFYEVKWNKNIDYMIIDSPPGTGDIALDLRTIIPTADVLIVTTPHLAASHVAIKAGYAAKQLGHSILGVIENMSYYLNPVNKQKDFLFGSGGGEAVAEKLETEVVSQIPINQPLHHLGLYELDEEIGKIYNDLAELILYKTQ